ncbi:phage tail tape measure protein [Kitasatospora cathayae]|uniref:Phage tail tape measure protein n=1 Tax=Kitasatospora cathayae TaxID=3004092 RepID=A0ABY7QA86_9ACTN|nr:phage tail tape measure protein [Kitasatospora sp. HUAS 3-15]WBP89542.1 phage tail tape measure protein [Kitasatospora sp. HUAS 3-15]
MATEVADLYSILRVETAPFSAGLRTASEEGESFTAKMGGLGGMMSKLGAATTMAGVAVAGVSIKMAGDFQASMLKLTTTAGESEKNLGMVSEGVKKLAVDTGTSTKQLADGMYLVESAGFHGADGLTVLKAAAEGARAEQAPLAEVSNAVTSALKSYHLPAEQATTITNQMVAAVGAGKMTFSEFSSSLATVLPIASAAHLGFDQIGGAIATLTNHGTSAREATQELAFSIRSLQAPNNVAVQEMQRLGLSSVDISTKLGERGLTGTIGLLQQAILQHMGPAGTVLLSTFNSSKQAAADANAMLASMPKSLQDVAKEFQAGKISMGDWRSTLKGLPVDQANLASQFATLINKSQGFNQQLKAGGPAEETFNASMKKMMGGATGLNTALMLGGESMADFEKNVATVGEAGKNAGKDIHGWAEIQQTFNFQMSQLKERLEVAAITIGTKLIPVVLAVTNYFMQHKVVAEALAAIIGGVLTAAVIRFAAGAVVGAVKGIRDIGAGLKAATIAVRDFELGTKLAAAASKVMAVAQAALNAVMDANPIMLIVIGLAALVAGLVYAYNHSEAFRRIVQAAFRGVEQAALSVWHTLQSVWSGLVGAAASLWHGIESSWRAVAAVTTAIFGGIHDFFAKWWPLLLVIFLPVVAIFVAIWNHFHEQIISAATSAWSFVRDICVGAWDFLLASARFIWRIIQEAVVQPILSAVRILQDAWSEASSWLSQKWRSISEFSERIWSEIKRSIVEPIASAASSCANFIGNIASSIWNGLVNAWNSAKQIAGSFAGIGMEIINGIIRGISNGWSWLKDKIKNLASDALSAAKSFLGISSPSKVFAAEVGQWIPHGIAKGIDDHGQVAVDSMTGLAGNLTGKFGSGGAPGLTMAGGLSAAASSGPVVVLNVTVQGSVLSENDLRDVLEQQMYRLGMRNSTTWQNYARR